MKVDPNALQPSALLRLLNGTPLGTVTTDRRLRARLDAAGTRVAGAKPGRVSLVRFVGHLLGEWIAGRAAGTPSAAAEPRDPGAAYAAKKERERKRAREAVRNEQDLARAFPGGRMPEAEDLDRREACRTDFARYVRTYGDPDWKPFSAIHWKRAARLNRLGLEGGHLASLLPRNYAKTTWAELWVEWGMLFGHFPFVELIFSGDDFAERSVESIRKRFEHAEGLLARDFPEVHYPVLALDHIRNRCRGQKWGDRPTGIDWGDDRIVFPVVPKAGRAWDDGPFAEVVADSAGWGLVSLGIRSKRVHGAKFTSPRDGKTYRPRAVAVDDVVDDISARSPIHTATTLRIIKNGIGRSRSLHQRFSILYNGTMQAPGDVSDVLTTPKLSTKWQGERVSALVRWPDRKDLWDRFGEMLADFEANADDDSPRSQVSARARADAFYRRHRKAMDAGAEVAWDHAYNADEGERSALHALMLVYYGDGPEVFACSCQNRPLDPAQAGGADRPPSSTEFAERLNRLPRGEVPAGCVAVTGFVDVQDCALFWLVCAWRADFTGFVVDYGVFPEQPSAHFAARDIADGRGAALDGAWRAAHPGQAPPDKAGLWHWGFGEMADRLCGRAWTREDGAELRMARLLFDASDGEAGDTVHDFCRRTPHANVVMAAVGAAAKATDTPFNLRPEKPGQRRGDAWVVAPVPGRKTFFVRSDANHWKTFVLRRLRTAPGSPGALTVFGTDPREHALLFDHWAAETPQRVTGPQWSVLEWFNRLKRENHWWDGLVGCAVGASLASIRLPGQESAKAAPGGVRRRMRSYAEVRKGRA